MVYEKLKADMTAALKSGDKLRRLTLADIVATIDKTATAGKSRVEITDAFCNEILVKYQKTVQEMIDTCPLDRVSTLNEYHDKMAIVREYAPQLITDIDEIEKMINYAAVCNGVSVNSAQRGVLMKAVMPVLKREGCDMKCAQEALKSAMAKGDAALEVALR